MSNEEIDKLEGRELDAAVAERVFGWQWWERPNREGQHSKMRKAIYPPEKDVLGYERWNFSLVSFKLAKPETERFSDWDQGCGKRRADGYHVDFGLPPFSTDIAAVWSVVEKIKTDNEVSQRAFANALAAQLRVRDCDYSTIGTIQLTLFGNGDAPGISPLAICRAALRAAPPAAPNGGGVD